MDNKVINLSLSLRDIMVLVYSLNRNREDAMFDLSVKSFSAYQRLESQLSNLLNVFTDE